MSVEGEVIKIYIHHVWMLIRQEEYSLLLNRKSGHK
jgi:hypothetical protein